MNVHSLRKTALSILLSLTVAAASAQQIKLVNALAATLGNSDYQIKESVMMGGRLYFSTKSAQGTALWRTDGAAATILYRWGFGGDYAVNKLYVLNSNQLLFTGYDSLYGKELWTSDGTVAGTKLLKDIVPGPDGSMAGTSPLTFYFGLTHQAFAFKDGYAYFCATTSSDTGARVWRTDGTTAGTERLPDFINLLRTESFGANVGLVNNKLILSYFANQSTNSGRVSTDGTLAGTTVFTPTSSGDEHYFPCNGKLLFRQSGLSATDGTVAGTITLDSFHTFSSGDILALGNKVYYFSNRALWVTDGTPAGTHSVADSLVVNGTTTGAVSSFGSLDNRQVGLSVLESKLYFVGDKATLWESDGTKAGTSSIIQPTSIDSNGSGGIYKLTTLNGKLYFRGIDSFRVWLYESDGTAAGTRKVRNPASNYLDMRFDYWNNPAGPGRYQPFVDEIMTVNNKILFTALYDSALGKALYSLDLPTAVKEPSHPAASLTVYPNPTPGQLSLRYPANRFNTIDVSDAMGRLIRHQPADNGGKQELDLSALPKGAYYIRLSGSGEDIGTVVLLRF